MFIKKEKAKNAYARMSAIYISVLLYVSCIVLNPILATIDKSYDNGSCNCVVFRLDDVQDYWINDTQILLMDKFIDKGLTLSLGLIMHDTGNDSSIVNKVSEGYKKGLFELALHGWDHIDYTKLGKDEQMRSLFTANEKMQRLFGNTSDVFIPPFNEFNNDTISAMAEAQVNILSSSLHQEERFDQGGNIYMDKETNNNYNSSSTSTSFTSNTNNGIKLKLNKIIHLPETNEFERYQNHTWMEIPVHEILRDTLESINDYGYAVITLQPQSFIKTNSSGKPDFTKQEIDIQSFYHLSSLLDSLLNNKVKMASYYDVVD
jgi:peptidoglycan/xylan/chitin deacetylase (PgdA/CDA1 family)